MTTKQLVVVPRTTVKVLGPDKKEIDIVSPLEVGRFYLNISREVNDIAADLIVAEADIDTAESDIDTAESDIDDLETWQAVMDAVAAKTGTATLTTSERRILCSGTFTVTLPTAVGNTGKDYYIKNTGTGIITVEGDGSETIDNNLNIILASMDSAHVVSDNVEWWII